MKARHLSWVIIMAVAVGCGGGSEAPRSGVATVMVRTQAVTQADFPVTIRLGGTLKGDHQTTIPARVTTTVIDVPVHTGQRVGAGDLLVMLDPGGVQSQYRQAEAICRNAEKQHKKMKSLYESGAISEVQLDAAETEYTVAQANFDAARQTIEIRAPFSGVVTDIFVRIGDEVAPGVPVVGIADVRSLRLYLDTPPGQVGQIHKGQRVSVVSLVETAGIMTGEVVSIADAADRNTRSFEVECHFAQPPAGFSPGMYIIAGIETRIIPGAILVPNDAILYRGGQALVYVVSNDSASLVPVEIIAAGGEVTAVTGNLTAGQKAVVVGQKNLTPGTAVREAVL